MIRLEDDEEENPFVFLPRLTHDNRVGESFHRFKNFVHVTAPDANSARVHRGVGPSVDHKS